MEDLYIRKVANGDEVILAYIQTESWKAAFKNIITDDLLVKYTEINRATEMYLKLLKNKKGNGYILEVNGNPHCMAWWDTTRESNMSGYAELICIHSLPDNWRNGYGSKMMDRVLGDIRQAGYENVMLWVFTENRRACSFYETKGFVATDNIKAALGVTETMYIYKF